MHDISRESELNGGQIMSLCNLWLKSKKAQTKTVLGTEELFQNITIVGLFLQQFSIIWGMFYQDRHYNHKDHCYRGNWIKSGLYGSTGKNATQVNYNFIAVWWKYPTSSWSNRASKSAFPDFQVTMAIFSNFYEFWFIVTQRPIFLPNFKFLALTVSP